MSHTHSSTDALWIAVALALLSACSSDDSSKDHPSASAGTAGNVQTAGAAGKKTTLNAGSAGKVTTGGQAGAATTSTVAEAGHAGTPLGGAAGKPGAGAGMSSLTAGAPASATGGTMVSAGAAGAPTHAGSPATAGTTATIATAGAPGTAMAGAPGKCPLGLAGPAMIQVPGSGNSNYCVDATEVTNGQYAEFLAAGFPTATSAWCSWNKTQVPSNSWPANGRASYPVVFVDWCDAFDYCKWAGKRLCTSDELQSACSKGGTQTYPYGSAYNATACNGDDFNGISGPDGADSAGSVGTATCVGGYPGLYDLTGNVNEWTSTCSAMTASPPDANCTIYGGSFKVHKPTCKETGGSNADIVTNDVGFRCCASAP